MITVKVDARAALAWYGPSGIPEAVRRNLRASIPNLTKRLGVAVEKNLDTGLKSRKSLEVKKEMVENPTTIYGRVTVRSTSGPKLLPLWLEEGTRAHVIEAKPGGALFFFWEKMGMFMMLKRVNHPGFAGIQYARNAFDGMRDEIVTELNRAVKTATQRAA